MTTFQLEMYQNIHLHKLARPTCIQTPDVCLECLLFVVFCPMIWYFLEIPQSHLLPMNLFLACTLQPSKHCFHAETVWLVCVLTNNSSCHIPSRLVHRLSCLWLRTVSRHKPRRLSSIIHHLETHQLKGQHFVGSWVIYNLLKVSSNCNAEVILQKSTMRSFKIKQHVNNMFYFQLL